MLLNLTRNHVFACFLLVFILIGCAADSSTSEATVLSSPYIPSSEEGVTQMTATVSASPEQDDSLPESHTTLLRVVYTADGQQRIWREETTQSEPFNLPSSVDHSMGLGLSADGRFTAFSLKPDDDTLELWVYDHEQQVEKQLAFLSATPIQEQYPEATAVELVFQWVPGSYLLLYYLEPHFEGIGNPRYEAINLIDAESGETKASLEVEQAQQVQVTPDLKQLVALTDNGVHLVDLDTAQTKETTISLEGATNQAINFTPDEESILLFTPDGITILNRNDLTDQVIPFAYQPIGDTHFVHYPPIHWLTDTTFFTILPEPENGVVTATNTIFTIWEIDIQQKTAQQGQTYNGIFNTIRVAPNSQKLIYLSQQGSNMLDLSIADVSTGNAEVYESGQLLFIGGWNKVSTHFVYFNQNEPEIRIGQPGQAPAIVPQPGKQNYAFFADSNSLLITSCQVDDATCVFQHGALQENQLPVLSTIVMTTNSEFQYQYFSEKP